MAESSSRADQVLARLHTGADGAHAYLGQRYERVGGHSDLPPDTIMRTRACDSQERRDGDTAAETLRTSETHDGAWTSSPKSVRETASAACLPYAGMRA